MEEAPSFSQKRCLAWFREYTNPDDPDTLGPDGMEKFCEDIGVEPENVVMLVLAYKMQARQMGFFTQEEWLKGLTDLQCDVIQKLQTKLEYLRSHLNDQNLFKAIYRYAFDFARVIINISLCFIIAIFCFSYLGQRPKEHGYRNSKSNVTIAFR